MSDWVWIEPSVIFVVHDEQLTEHGGAPGLRDAGLLDSALARPRNLVLYGTPDYAELAAAYAISLAKNHAFVDGNKRIGAFLFIWFLDANGLLYRKDGSKRLADNALVALTLLIAESKPAEKDIICKVIVNLINRDNL